MAEEKKAEDLARERASQEARKAQQSESDREPWVYKDPLQTAAEKLTTYEELIQREAARTSIVKTNSGLAFEIKGLSPGDFVIIMGSPFVKSFISAGVESTDKSAAEKIVKGLEPERAIELISDPDLLSVAKTAICSSVLSVNFVSKPQEQCDPEQKEVSVDQLDFVDLMNLFNAIMRLSTPGVEVTDAMFFRKTGEEAQGSDDSGSSDRERLRSEAIQDTVPLGNES